MSDTTASVSTPPTGRLARFSMIVAILALLVSLAGAGTLLYAVIGYHMGFAQLGRVLQGLLPLGAQIAGVGAVVSLIATLVFGTFAKKGTRRAAIISAAGVIIGAAAFYIPYSVRHGAEGSPPIHDVTTDTDNPPEFIDAVPLRKATGARNPVEYLRESRLLRGVSVPDAQHKAFPEIQPIVLPGMAPADAFKRALAAVDAMHWHLTAAKAEEGRIEAWDQTFWFRFIDDVVIRVTPTEGGSKVDIRSLSRIGGGDAGTNARRIRNYIAVFPKS